MLDLMLFSFSFLRILIIAVYNCLEMPAVLSVFVLCLCHTFQRMIYMINVKKTAVYTH